MHHVNISFMFHTTALLNSQKKCTSYIFQCKQLSFLLSILPTDLVCCFAYLTTPSQLRILYNIQYDEESTVSNTALWPAQPPIQWVPAVLSPGVKRPRREADHSPATSAEVKNAWSYTSTPQYVFMAWCLVRHRDNFTFTFYEECKRWIEKAVEGSARCWFQGTVTIQPSTWRDWKKPGSELSDARSNTEVVSSRNLKRDD
jgi:hypothetical protein